MPRISQLPSLTTADNSDEIAIVDTSASTTKKITRGDLLKAPLPANSVTTAALGEISNIYTSGTVDLNDFTKTGFYSFTSGLTTITNVPVGSNGYVIVMNGGGSNAKQIWFRQGTIDTNDYNTYIRTKSSAGWSSWHTVTVTA